MNKPPIPVRLAIHLTTLTALVALAGCQADTPSECLTSTDCPGSRFCKLGKCVDLNDPALGGHSGLPEGLDAGPVDDTDLHAQAHPCPDAPAADATNLVLNEILATVPTGEAGDANGDGTRHYHDDEFVELVNTADETIELTGVRIFNDEQLRFTFHRTCLAPLHAVVVFGGIEAGAQLPAGEGYRSYVADSRFAYADAGGRAVVLAADGATIADFTYGSHPAESLNLEVDLQGTEYIPHGDLTEGEEIFSPGTCSNGLPFPTGCREEDETDRDGDSLDHLDDLKN